MTLEDGVDLAAWGFDLDGAEESWLAGVRRAEEPLALGKIGEFELIEEVSRGGQGVVFRARQPGTGREIALKRLIAGSLSTDAMRQRFEREIEAAAALSHPNIVTVYGMETIDGMPVYAMEWIDGVRITHWAAGRRCGDTAPPDDEGCRDPRESLEVFLRVCDALQHAHSRGVLHRDLKPSNILVDDAGQPHVLDFGLAKRMAGSGIDEASLTQSNGFVGTPSYAAPEQFRGSASLDDRADVYALGVVLFETLTGRLPYESARFPGAVATGAWSEQKLLRPSSLDPRLGRELDVIACKALADEPGERYMTVGAFAQDIRRYLAGEPIHALPPSSLYLFQKLVRRNKLASGLISAVFGLSVVFAATLWRMNRDLAQSVADLQQTIGERDRALADRDDAIFEAKLKTLNLADYRSLLPPCLDPVKNASKNPDFVLRDYSDDVWDESVRE